MVFLIVGSARANIGNHPLRKKPPDSPLVRATLRLSGRGPLLGRGRRSRIDDHLFGRRDGSAQHARGLLKRLWWKRRSLARNILRRAGEQRFIGERWHEIVGDAAPSRRAMPDTLAPPAASSASASRRQCPLPEASPSRSEKCLFATKVPSTAQITHRQIPEHGMCDSCNSLNRYRASSPAAPKRRPSQEKGDKMSPLVWIAFAHVWKRR